MTDTNSMNAIIHRAGTAQINACGDPRLGKQEARWLRITGCLQRKRCKIMEVTDIVKYGKYKYLVYLNMEFAFWLSWKELYFWKIQKGNNLTQLQYDKIMKETVLEKCKRKAFAYLQYGDCTEFELRTKLKRQKYIDPIIDQVIDYLYQYAYIDDQRYVENFLLAYKNKKSKRWMEMRLKQKGIPKEWMELLEKEDNMDEVPLRKEIKKKVKGRSTIGFKEQQRILASVCRKGFSFQKAKEVLQEQVTVKYEFSKEC